MKRFQFRLETLLQMRKRKEEQARLALAKKNREIINARGELAEIHDDLSELQASEKAERATTADVEGLKHSVSYRHKLKQDLLRKGKEIDRLRGDSRTLQVSLQLASKDKKAVELLKEKRVAEWRKENKSEEQSITDEISQQGYIRKSYEQSGPQED